MSDTFNIVVGDWSNDGHGHTDTQLINTALTYSDVENAWDEVNKKLDTAYGFDLHEVCQDYEDWFLTKEQSNAFIDMGIKLDEIAVPASEYYGAEGRDVDFALDSDSYVNLILVLLNEHNPLLALVRAARPNHRKELHVGGYGLFSD